MTRNPIRISYRELSYLTSQQRTVDNKAWEILIYVAVTPPR